MKFIETEYSKGSKSHYYPGVVHDGILYVSGQISLNLETKKLPDTFEGEVFTALDNVERVLRAAGTVKENVIMCRAYIPDIALWDEFNEAYAKWFGPHKPARVVVPTRELHYGCRVEIEAVAALTDE